MNTDTQEVRLQWIKGDKVPNVEKVVSQDGEWTLFESGSRIATNLIHEFMLPIEGEPLDFDIADAIQPIQNNVNNQAVKTQVKKYDNPIRTLFNKQKKTDKVDLKLNFSINVPTKDIFSIISMTFDEDEVVMELDSFISDQIDASFIKDTLRTAIEELIDTRYKTKKN